MRLIQFLFKLLPIKIAYAHCDIPCGIYDPTPAQIAAHTVVRMTNLIAELPEPKPTWKKDKSSEWAHNLARLTKVKEDHAEIVKHEVRVIWGDYFKQENYKDLTGLNKKVYEIMHLASSARQNIDVKTAEKLLAAVQEFSEIFYKSKKLTPIRIPSGFPTKGELVTHK